MAMDEIKARWTELFKAGRASEVDARMIMRTAAYLKGGDRPDLATACLDLAAGGWTLREVYDACA